jgi:hypothetical protein
MKIKLPRKIKIGGHTFVVERKVMDGDYAGMIDFENDVIYFDRRCTNVGTVIHEIAHGVAKHMHAPLSEEWTCRVAEAVAMVIADNPKLVRALVDALEGYEE